MAKIVLSQNDIALIGKHVSGDYNPFFATEEEKERMNRIIDEATELVRELEAYDEVAEKNQAILDRIRAKKIASSGVEKISLTNLLEGK